MNPSRLIQLKPNEEVIMTVRQSVIPLLPKFLLSSLWLVLPFFLMFPLFRLKAAGVIAFVAILVSGLYYAYRTYLLWHNTVCVITDQRIVDVDQRGLFHRVVSEASHQAIRDISYRIRGVAPTIFRYGNVEVVTEDHALKLQILRVHRPSVVHDLINDLRHGEYETDEQAEYDDDGNDTDSTIKRRHIV